VAEGRAEEHMARVVAQGDSARCGNDQAMEDLRRILETRAMLYRQADVVVDTAESPSRRAWPSCGDRSPPDPKRPHLSGANHERSPGNPAHSFLVTYDTHPGRYAHWKLSFDGHVATLSMDVDEDKGLKPGYKLKLNSYDLGGGHRARGRAEPALRFEHPEVKCVVESPAHASGMFCSGANIYMLGSSTHA